MLHACVEVGDRRGRQVSLERALLDRLCQRPYMRSMSSMSRSPRLSPGLGSCEVDVQRGVRGSVEQARPRIRAQVPFQQLGDVARSGAVQAAASAMGMPVWPSPAAVAQNWISTLASNSSAGSSVCCTSSMNWRISGSAGRRSAVPGCGPR